MKKIGVFFLITFIVFLVVRFFSPAPDIKNSQPTGDNIICFGDSLTFGTGASQGMDYPSQLSRMIGQPITNAGVSGDTTATAIARLPEAVLSPAPRIVLITLGGNDLKNRVPKEKAFANLKTIIDAIQEQGALVIIGEIDIPFYGRGFGDAYEEVCDETGSLLIPNIFKGVIGNPYLMSDPIHPNDAGYTVMAKHFYETIKPYLP